jgi:hypothetical protein
MTEGNKKVGTEIKKKTVKCGTKERKTKLLRINIHDRGR